jgi:sec-independent protein translocase protein TatC
MTSKSTKEEMTFVQHLIELRDKLLRSVIVIVIIFLILLPFRNEIYEFISSPIKETLSEDETIIITNVFGGFLVPVKMALIFAIYIAIPYLLYQIWSFVAPALYKHEKRKIVPLVVSSTILFYAGLLFSFYAVFSPIFEFLSGINPDGTMHMPSIQEYLDTVIAIAMAFGVAFEVPIATILLIMFGATTVEKLKKNRPYIIIGAFVFGMLLTPPDPISQLLIAVPMWLLFEVGLIFAPMFKRKNPTEPTNDDDPSKPSKDSLKNDADHDHNDESDDEDWYDEALDAEMDKIDEEFNKLDKE